MSVAPDPDCSVAPDPECSAAAVTRVFGTPELLEIVLINVALGENEVVEDTFYTLTPFTLRAVNRVFQHTIDGSAKLQRLRLQHVNGPNPNDSVWPGKWPWADSFGPLGWIAEMAELDCTHFSKVEQGVLHIRLQIYSELDEDEDMRLKLRKDLVGSWRKVPCVPKIPDTPSWKVISRVMLHLEHAKAEPLDDVDPIIQSCDLGPAPTVGLLFDVMDAGKNAIDIFYNSGGYPADLGSTWW